MMTMQHNENNSPLATRHSLLELRGTLRQGESMARHTSWRVGGPAQHFFQPADIDDLGCFLRQLSATEPLLWLGLGSNLLVRDGGFNGSVIALSGALNQLTLIDALTVRAEAGVACAKVARFAARAGLAGIEFLAGIPGTVGGALAINAGAHGGETWQWVCTVETLDRHGERHLRTPQDYHIGYRSVQPRAAGEEWFVAAHFRLAPGVSAAISARIKQLLEKRNQTQPVNQPNAGSVFRNPPGDHAARLIESCGLKGLRIGGACVSDKHANFIINTGTATAADIEALIKKMADTVQQKCNVQLVAEVRVVGESV